MIIRGLWPATLIFSNRDENGPARRLQKILNISIPTFITNKMGVTKHTTYVKNITARTILGRPPIVTSHETLLITLCICFAFLVNNVSARIMFIKTGHRIG